MISDLASRAETRLCQTSIKYTPIFVLTSGDDPKCYNYGTNLNELPNYIHLNQFFLFLYPDMNSIFVISFFFLNSFLVLIFFEFNESVVRQFMRGLSYLLLFNLILFSIWLLTINTNSKQIVRVTEFAASYIDRLLVYLRYILMYNDTTRFVSAGLRFFAFYYVYVNPYLLAINYCFVCILFYLHTRYNFIMTCKSSLLPIQTVSVKSSNETRCSRVRFTCN